MTRNCRGSSYNYWTDIGTLAIKSLTLHDKLLVIAYFPAIKTLRRPSIPSDFKNLRGSHTTRYNCDVGAVGGGGGR